MIHINKTHSSSVIDFAAEELKKYLRMMMPECGDIKISYDPTAQGGFRLGLAQDMGLDISDAPDPSLDDLMYANCDTYGGVIAGSNPRAVLLAVYEYLRQNGCRWLLPGVDGEYIPMQDIVPVTFRILPSCRYRSYCYEGAVIQQSLLDMIDLSPKLGMNTYMLEHRETIWHYGHYYEHLENKKNRAPEPISRATAIQWKRAAESEIAKRGLIYHNVGHGWTSEPFKDDPKYPSEYAAMLNGKRALHGGAPVYTNVCMSNPEVRRRMCEEIVSYSRRHSNTDYLHVWLADMFNNHCECDACRERTPSDWYVILLNEIDASLTEAGLDTRIVFISYVDTMWAPEREVFNNPDRFTLLFAPITRSYTDTLPPLPENFKPMEYVRNKLTLPATLTESLAYLEDWKKVYDGVGIAFEYHFWRHCFLDPTGIATARRINEDVRAYLAHGISGMIEDGTVRPFFPNGYALYTAARSMLNSALTAEQIAEDYFPYLYGDAWREIYGLLTRLEGLFDTAYLEGERSVDPDVSAYYNPAHAEKLAEIPSLIEEMRAVIRANYNSDYRVSTVAIRLLEDYCDYCVPLADALREKALGNEEEAQRKFVRMFEDYGKREARIERYYDHFMAQHTFTPVFRINSNKKKPIIV